jgi:hypothetical protein
MAKKTREERYGRYGMGDTAWIAAASDDKMKRFTIDVPERLHRRIRVHCLHANISMAEYMRQLAERDLSGKHIKTSPDAHRRA